MLYTGFDKKKVFINFDSGIFCSDPGKLNIHKSLKIKAAHFAHLTCCYVRLRL